MQFKDESIDLEEEVFDLEENNPKNGAWWWWFWLFFLDKPSDTDNPRQVALLWSSKDEKRIDCNEKEITFNHEEGEHLDGVVAAWYFDGEKMHHNLILEECMMNIGSNYLETDDDLYTSFLIEKGKCKINVEGEFEFIAEPKNEYDFAINSSSSGDFPLDFSYSMLKSNRLDLEGEIRGEKVEGSAYFQRVFVNAPATPWYWGIFHFENGGLLDYYNPKILGKSIKKEIAFHDGKRQHEFEDIDVEREENEDLPIFHISAENEKKKIDFTVEAYSHSSWDFKKTFAGVIPNKLTYNEYPAKITRLKLVDKRDSYQVDLEDLGASVGNAEHTTGLLL